MEPEHTHSRSITGARLRVDGKFFRCGDRRVHLQGVTYGPFPPNSAGEPFPSPGRVRDDFARMRELGVNAIRMYHPPAEWLLDLADEEAMGIFVDIPWAKHLCFLDDPAALVHARNAVQSAAKQGSRHHCIAAYSIGNEIPPNVVRWHGARRVERFLAELVDIARQADPEGLVTYGNFPSTEYLDLSFADFATFNVYLHDREAYRRYLFRLQNLVGDRPLVLGELGMDTLRHGESQQAAFLEGHLRKTGLMGLAGAFVFSWTDDWHTGGHQIQDWAFGITDSNRQPKPACKVVQEIYTTPLTKQLPETPSVSVVVCSYNGGRTLDQCIRSLLAIDYPNYEIIVVDDGSTDDTRAIIARYPNIRAIHQENLGLSVARNAGLYAATGSIVAYTDSDCFADPHWLTHLVYQFVRSNADAVGGPNLSPDDGWLAACVAASPGQPMHVLVSDQEAEHIPGCNMAFRRDALLEVKGFDPLFRKAGDDVDLCWRMQHSGHWITFAPGAFVWHHRRQTPRAYFKQQAGYGEAEALLRFKHPNRFNGRGDGKWNGVLYGASLKGLHTSDAVIYQGVFGTGLFQCIYQPGPSHWATLPATLEWHLSAAIAALTTIVWSEAWLVAVVMLMLSFAVASIQAAQARLARQYRGVKSRLLVTFLCYAQPLARSWKRYITRFFAYRVPRAVTCDPGSDRQELHWRGTQTAAYWSENGTDRLQLLGAIVQFLNDKGWGKTIDSGWDAWDLEIYCHPWTVLQVSTAEEEHGYPRRLIRVRYQLRTSNYLNISAAIGIIGGIIGAVFSLGLVCAAAGVCMSVSGVMWWLGIRRASHGMAIVQGCVRDLNLTAIQPGSEQVDRPPVVTGRRLSRPRRWIGRQMFGRQRSGLAASNLSQAKPLPEVRL